ncbi:transcription initiation factor TFIID subunit 7 isoform X3 [Nilaparvata lugens]|uniref:transcription initiation factor TFIID subunit 7 isoform X1 n=1 Tax=Nilaparvata lugens TaxID=108931 RepID=UPI00193D10C4|nr:transcription initiation factor TFIID subunit 7 isoform X1 [Nilaparvata lugens]XP_039291309.1 transcription initiation factor TFIID subunit 7 isoform X2 [Nilaparvata lugens]XP_039291310.1 transcription initiation factor TFIID subunit 7 isoform X3 [Nilaparvata lugens]
MNRQSEISRKEAEGPVELESQFILRLPEEPAKALREALRSGVTSLKDRLSIKLENDIRYGEVRVDHWLMHAKVLDLPTIVESLKTIDNKSFYKTADICQIMICKEEDDQTTTDEESPQKHKKKDPNKVEKKYLYPHGITPPLKNVRKRRFRKTLKKKYVEAPEIEKEVKRLLRGDTEAVNVRWEVISEEEEKKAASGLAIKEEPIAHGIAHNTETTSISAENNVDVAEHDIFGEAVSDSEDEDQNIVVMEELSNEDSRLSDSQSMHGRQLERGGGGRELITEFRKEMFNSEGEGEGGADMKQESNSGDYDMYKSSPTYDHENDNDNDNDQPSHLSISEIQAKLEVLQQQLSDLAVRRHQQEVEIANIENMALRQRFQEILDSLLQQQLEKEHKYQELMQLLQMQQMK